jgi:hypothetical protein
MDHVVGRGSEPFAAVCASDLEGIVAKWKNGWYHSDGCTTSWQSISISSRRDFDLTRGPVARPREGS